MKKIFQLGLVVTTILIGCSGCGNCGNNLQPVNGEELLLADPTIINLNGKYYLAGTQGGKPAGFSVYVSEDLQNWEAADSLPNLEVNKENVYGKFGFWAPQFFPHEGKMAMLYTANEQVAFAIADSVTGKYSGNGLAIDDSEKNIDPFLFRDDDGKYYLYHVRFNRGNYLWVGEFDIENKCIVPGTLKQLFSNDQPWEHTLSFDSDPIMEGPTVVKLKDTYYLFYSANHFQSIDYAVGYATASSPMGPWTKNPDNPIIHSSIVGEKGAGHGDLFVDNSGAYKYVYHVHNSDSVVSPRKTRILSLNLEPTANDSVPYKITVDPSSIIIPIK